MNNTELYEVLGIKPEERRLTGEDWKKVVKQRYREVAKQHHPDKFQDEKEKVEHEAIFKKAAEANEILSDAEKRRVYDMTGSTSGYQFDMGRSNIDLDDIIASFMNGRMGGFGDFGFFSGRQRQQERVYKGQDVQINVSIDLSDAINGVEKKYKYKRQVQCPSCSGSSRVDCPHCNGKGVITRVQQSGWSQMIQQSPCPHCHGTGKVVGESTCTKCHGEGTIEKEDIITVQIPKGVTNGNYIQKNGMGNEIPKNMNGKSGDLYVIIKDIKSNDFTIQEYDLVIEKRIPILDIITGTTIQIKTPTNRTLKINVPKNTENERVFRLQNEGIPVGNSGKKGSILVVVKHIFPERIDSKELKLIDELKKSKNFQQ